MNTLNELNALQNFANKFNLKVDVYRAIDKRKKPKFLLLKKNGLIVSPILNYDNMNHLLLGIDKCKKYDI